jgi:protease IV
MAFLWTPVVFCIGLASYGQVLELSGGGGDVRGFQRGVAAVGSDPAAVSKVDSLALTYRHHWVQGESGWGRFGAAVAWPIGPLSLHGGHQWFRIPESEFSKGLLGASWSFGPRLSLGLSWEHLYSDYEELKANIWNIGVFSELTSWLTFSLGVDGFNSPHLLGTQLAPDYVFGLSLRPLFGEPWLTLGAEFRVGRSNGDGYSFVMNRAVADVSPTQGLHIQVAYQHQRPLVNEGLFLDQPTSDRLWFGFTLSAGFIDGGFSALALNRQGGRDTLFGESHLALALSTQAKESLIEAKGRVVEISLSGKLQQAGGSFREAAPIALAPLRLHALAHHPGVAHIILSIGSLGVGMAVIGELRDAVKSLRDHGKKVSAVLRHADDKAYLVASACDYIVMDPVGMLSVNGFASTQFYWAEALEKVGVKVEVIKVGHSKTGPEPLVRNTPSEEMSAMMERLLAQAHTTLHDALVEERGLSSKEVQHVLAKGYWKAQDALEAGLVDALFRVDDVSGLVVEPKRGFRDEDVQRPSVFWSKRPTIRVIPVVGTLVTGADEGGLIPGPKVKAQDLLYQLEAAGLEKDVKAVVVRIVSPGGSVYGAELVWRAVKNLAERKPVIVSMGDVAASGGYYIASAAHAIVAERHTVTGSIGIFALKPDFSALATKVGVHPQPYQTGPLANIRSTSKGYGDAEREALAEVMNFYYQHFMTRVAAGRDMEMDKVASVAQGQVYTGKEALQLGLVDELGGLHDAIEMAKAAAGLGGVLDIDIGIARPPFKLKQWLKRGLLKSQTSSIVEALGGMLEPGKAAIGESIWTIDPCFLKGVFIY